VQRGCLLMCSSDCREWLSSEVLFHLSSRTVLMRKRHRGTGRYRNVSSKQSTPISKRILYPFANATNQPPLRTRCNNRPHHAEKQTLRVPGVIAPDSIPDHSCRFVHIS